MQIKKFIKPKINLFIKIKDFKRIKLNIAYIKLKSFLFHDAKEIIVDYELDIDDVK